MASYCKIFMNNIKKVDHKQYISLKTNEMLSECTCKISCNFSHDLNKYKKEQINKKIDEYLILSNSRPL